jgi:hypothetical protein
MWKEAPVIMTKFSLQGTENLGETSVITVEIRIRFYRKANKYYSENFGNKISVILEAV